MNCGRKFSENMLAIYKNPESIREEEKHIAIALSCLLTRTYVKVELCDFQELKDNAYRFFDTLKEQEYNVVIRYYGLDGKAPRTFAEIAAEFHKSEARINAIEHKVLRKFRHWNKQIELQKIESMNSPSRKIEELKLSNRPYVALKREGIHTIEELSKLTIADLRNIRNIGKKSIDEIISKLSKIGITIAKKCMSRY